MSPRKSAKDRDRDRQSFIQLAKVESITKVLVAAIKWIAISYLAWCGVQAIEALAGKATLADISVAVKWLTGDKKSEFLAWGVGAGGVLYGLRQRRLRKDLTEHFGARELELGIDPGRTSSMLTSRGDTNPRDQT